jgi:tetratricopeptide (TPR) repeat protein
MKHRMAGSSSPKISVVIPNYNHGHCLGNAMQSVCTQDPPPHELYVFDDCSTDNSLEVIESFARRFPFVRLLRYPRKSADWVKACSDNLCVLSGDYVLSLAADDYIYPGLVRELGEMIRRNPQCGVFFSDWHYVDGNRNVIWEMRSGIASARFLEGTELAHQLCTLTMFEAGVGSIVRKDLLLWLNTEGAVAMGSFYDAMGYPVMAMKHGACYVPSFLAACSAFSAPGRDKHSVESVRDPRKAVELLGSVKRFLESQAIVSIVPAEVREALELKSLLCVDLPERDAIVWRRAVALAQGLIGSRRLQQADRWVREVVRVFPHHAEAHFLLGVVQYKLGRLADAELAFQRAVELDPGMAKAHSNWGACRHVQGFCDDAIAAYRRSIEADAGFAEAYSNLGNLLFAQGRVQEALIFQQHLVKLKPAEASGFVHLSNTLLALGRREEALSACQKAMTLDPNLVEARTKLHTLLGKS